MPISQPNPNDLGYSNFGQATPKRVLVGLTSTPLLLANLSRVYVQFNNNTGQQIWVSKGIPAVVGQGTRLNIGTMLKFSSWELYFGQYNAITLVSPVNMDVEEGIP